MRVLLTIPLLLIVISSFAQGDRWQQHIECELQVDLDASTHRFTGTEKLVYRNNSPDTLRQLFFHLYLNAFKPGSEMDVRSRTIADPDPRVADRIAKLTPEEQGDLICSSVLQEGKRVQLEPLLQRPHRLHDPTDLRLEHHQDRVVPEVGVRAVEHEQVREPGDDGAEVGAGSAVTGVRSRISSR